MAPRRHRVVVNTERMLSVTRMRANAIGETNTIRTVESRFLFSTVNSKGE